MKAKEKTFMEETKQVLGQAPIKPPPEEANDSGEDEEAKKEEAEK